MRSGATVSHYELIERLGVGGMGEVWLARDTRSDRKVAVKFLSGFSTPNREARRRFLQEAKAAARLDHPGVVSVREFGEADDRVFLVMDYASGGSLRTAIDGAKGRPFSLDRVLRWGRQAAEGLAAAHQQGIIHRDIKPDNLLLNADDRLRISDFGLAHIDTETRLTVSGARMGTLGYMSPEQARGQNVDPRTDLFSLGATLYELLTGERPFDGSNQAAVLYAIVHYEPKPVGGLRPDAPPALTTLVTALLGKSPDHRPASAERVVEELDRIERLVSAGMTVPISPDLRRRPSAKRPMTVLGGVLLVLALGSIGDHVMNTHQVGEPGLDPKATVVFPFQYDGPDSMTYLASGISELLSATLNGVAGVRTVDPRGVLRAVDEVGGIGWNEELMAGISRSFGAGRFLHGRLEARYGTLEFSSVGIHETRRHDQPVYGDDTHISGMHAVMGRPEDLYLLVDRLTENLLRLELAPGEHIPKLASVTTASQPALRLFLEAGHEVRFGRLAAGAGKYEEAVALDSTFALARLRLEQVREESAEPVEANFGAERDDEAR